MRVRRDCDWHPHLANMFLRLMLLNAFRDLELHLPSYFFSLYKSLSVLR